MKPGPQRLVFPPIFSPIFKNQIKFYFYTIAEASLLQMEIHSHYNPTEL